jgi:hypothetical protein
MYIFIIIWVLGQNSSIKLHFFGNSYEQYNLHHRPRCGLPSLGTYFYNINCDLSFDSLSYTVGTNQGVDYLPSVLIFTTLTVTRTLIHYHAPLEQTNLLIISLRYLLLQHKL